MKKFNFKAILILVLTLILVFSLVACNKDQGPAEDPGAPTGDPNAIKSEQFFTDLWAASNSIGSTEIKPDDSIGLTADLALKVKIKDKKKTYKEIDLGIALQLVLDRKKGGADSAAKIKLYNAASEVNWITLYYFLNDPDFLYIDYQDKNIKFNFNFGHNDEIAGGFNDLLNTSVFPETSILDIVESITETTGEDFNLNNLVNTILGIVKEAADLDLVSLVQQKEVKSILSMLGIENIVDDKGNVNLLAVFNSSIVKSFLKNSKCIIAADGAKSYSTDIVLSSTITGALSGLLGDIGSILNNIGINLSFKTTANGSIDGFTIAVDLPGLSGKDSNTLDSKEKPVSMYPAVEITINNLEFVPVDTKKTSEYFGINKTKYNGDVAIDIALELDSVGATLTPKQIDPGYCTYHSSEKVSLDGKYAVRIQGNMDLSKLGEEDSAYLYVFIERILNENVLKPVQIIYDGKKIIFAMDKDVLTEDKKSIVEEIINALGKPIVKAMDDILVSEEDKDTKVNPLIGTILEEKEGYLKLKDDAPSYVTFDLDMYKLVQFVAGMFGIDTAPSEADEDTECHYPFVMSPFATIMDDVITALDTTDGLGVALPNKTIVEIMATWFKWNGALVPLTTSAKVTEDDVKANKESLYARAIAYNQNWYDTFRGLGFFADDEHNTNYNSLTKTDTDIMWAYATKVKGYSDYTAAITEDVATEEVFNKAIADLNVYFGDKVVKFAACPEAHWTEAVFNYVKTASVNISLDNGFAIIVKAGMDDTTKATLKLSVNANTALTREALGDIYEGIESKMDETNTLELGGATIEWNLETKQWEANGNVHYNDKK
ncbi:MAG: hypothetical protein MJ068_01695 [Clostridia bacterium]|nr:hypothetical protein [Clostridia bacterium]